ncbi:DNA repair protein RecN [Aurantivibrio plasticivorans]
MLTHLSINNYTLVEHLDLELHSGMTAVTGETGAGKSVMLDALGLTLGDRADADRIRAGADRADINASFDISALPEARAWLEDNALEGEPNECLLRRMISAEGRSRAFINGQPVTLAQIKALGEMLIDIHAQHEHQSLLKKETPRRLLDDYAGHTALVKEVSAAFREWQQLAKRFQTLKDNADEAAARVQLLSYQVNELDQLDLQAGEIDQLVAEQKQLANGESILNNSYQLTALCGGEEQSVLEGLNRALYIAQGLPQDIPAVGESTQLLMSAQIQVEEAISGMERFIDGFQLDPERLQIVDERLSAIFEISRKHRITPEELFDLHQKLAEELTEITGDDADLDQLEKKCIALESHYRSLAQKLSNQRQKAANKLSKAVNQQLHKLAMEHANLQVTLVPNEGNAQGAEDIQLLISTNPGQPLKPLHKIASGGELSRVSLAIQVVTAQTSATPTLVFDEVDVGIGGGTADTVGQMLRQLGEKAQILCVTHLAQVASKAHQHFLVSKSKKKGNMETAILPLSGDAKVEEIARMMGSDKLTATSLEHAKELMA